MEAKKKRMKFVNFIYELKLKDGIIRKLTEDEIALNKIIEKIIKNKY